MNGIVCDSLTSIAVSEKIIFRSKAKLNGALGESEHL